MVETTFDRMDRMIERSSALVPACPASEVEPVDESFAYDARGSMVLAENDHASFLREYDALDRLTRETDSRFGTSVAYRYDAASRLVARIYPDRTLLNVSHDAVGRPIGITDALGNTMHYVYDGAGRRIQTRDGTGLLTDLAYDGSGRLASIASHGVAPGMPGQTAATPAIQRTSLYDHVGNRTTVTDEAGVQTTYTYDALYRLIESDPSDETATHFEYSPGGDRLKAGEQDGGGQWTTYTQYAHTGGHRLQFAQNMPSGSIAEQLIYDDNGNPVTWVTGPTGRSLKWDALDRLVSISGSFSGTYVYGPLGRRLEKTEGGVTTRYQYDGLDVVADYDGAGTLLATYVFGPGIDEPIKIFRGGTAGAYHSDGMGSVGAITDVDTGSELVRYDYDAFGEPTVTGSFANAYRYTGREADASGLYYYRARYYLPSLGRFLTPDPIGLNGGANPYAYVNTNPENFRDPFGLIAATGVLSVNNEATPLASQRRFPQLAGGDAVAEAQALRQAQALKLPPRTRELLANERFVSALRLAAVDASALIRTRAVDPENLLAGVNPSLLTPTGAIIDQTWFGGFRTRQVGDWIIYGEQRKPGDPFGTVEPIRDAVAVTLVYPSNTAPIFEGIKQDFLELGIPVFIKHGGHAFVIEGDSGPYRVSY